MQPRLPYGNVRCAWTVGVLGLRLGFGEGWARYHRRTYSIPRVQSLWWNFVASMVLGLQCLHLDTLQVRMVNPFSKHTNLLDSDRRLSFVSRRVNYIFLFDFDPRIVSSPIQIFNEAVDNTLFFLWCMLLYYKVNAWRFHMHASPL
jgi:hypothetical protein